MSGSRIVHRRSNLGFCEGPMGYVVEEEKLVSVAAHVVYKSGVEFRPDHHVMEGVHTGDQGTVDVDPESPHGVNQQVHSVGSWGVGNCHAYRKDLGTANLVSLGTGNVVRKLGSVVLATVDAEAGSLGLVTGNVHWPVGVGSVGCPYPLVVTGDCLSPGSSDNLRRNAGPAGQVTVP